MWSPASTSRFPSARAPRYTHRPAYVRPSRYLNECDSHNQLNRVHHEDPGMYTDLV